MKKIIIFLLTIALFSCDKNDDYDYQTPNYYAGKWVFKKDGVLNSLSQIDYTAHSNGVDCMQGNVVVNIDNLVLNTDNTFVLTDYPYGSCANPEVISGNYAVNNGVINLSFIDNGVTYETSLNVIKFDQKALVVSFPSNSLLGNFGIFSLEKQ